ncbi:N-acetylmuramoyl-L-alanine amidase family protein [Thermus oshimai]
MRSWIALFLLGLALAQAPKPLKAGALTGEALYPGGRGVSYGEAGLLARGLGLALWQGKDQVALGLGARYKAFPLLDKEAEAAARGAAWRQGEKVYVPLRPLAEALGLQYRAQEGVFLTLPWAAYLGAEGENPRVFRFDREVNAVVRPEGVLFLLARGEGPGLEQEALGLFLPLPTPPDRVYYPGGGRVVLAWGRASPKPTVLLDPGHGGEDAGVEAGGLREKDLTLDLARKTAALLPGAQLTRTGDQTLSLGERLALAERASVVVSFHAAQGAGIALYLPKDRPSPLARSAEGLLATSPPDRARLLKVYAGSPERLAQALEAAFAKRGLVVARAEGPYALTRVSGAAVLLEVGLERLKTPEARAQVAQAVAEAIRAYLE